MIEQDLIDRWRYMVDPENGTIPHVIEPRQQATIYSPEITTSNSPAGVPPCVERILTFRRAVTTD